MLYLGIDQHKRQLTVNLRGEDGSVVLKRQVSTKWDKVREFFADLAEKSAAEGGFWAILEVCGMNPWLLEMLAEYGCAEIVVTQPTSRAKQKTDRRDASQLSHTLWVHRQQLAGGKHPSGLRRNWSVASCRSMCGTACSQAVLKCDEPLDFPRRQTTIGPQQYD